MTQPTDQGINQQTWEQRQQEWERQQEELVRRAEEEWREKKASDWQEHVEALKQTESQEQTWLAGEEVPEHQAQAKVLLMEHQQHLMHLLRHLPQQPPQQVQMWPEPQVKTDLQMTGDLAERRQTVREQREAEWRKENDRRGRDGKGRDQGLG
jgi:hypothetical protein